METLELSVTDRFYLLGLLPASGGLVRMRQVYDLHQKINFSLEEIDAYKIEDLPNGAIKYNTSQAQSVRIEISASQLELLKELIQKADEMQNVPFEVIPLVDRIEGVIAEK